MPALSFISDAALEEEVRHLIDVAIAAKETARKKFSKNVIDPFSAMFEIAGFQIDHNTWHQSEMARKAQKTLQNHIGAFHQNVLGQVRGWENLEKGNVVDLVNDGKQLIAEVKNKHNTISGGKLSDLYYTLDNLVTPKVSKYKGYTAYYVMIIPKKKQRFNEPFTPSDKEKGERCPENPRIRAIDGASFYALATGQPNALANLYSVLPSVIESVIGDGYHFTDARHVKKYFDAAFA